MEVPRGMEPTGTNGRTRHTFRSMFGGLGLVLWWFSRWMARNAVSCGHDDAGKAFDLLASVVRFPDRHDRNRGRFRSRPPSWLGLAVHSGFAVVMAQVRRPVPFRTRKLRPGTVMVLHPAGCGRVTRRRKHSFRRGTHWDPAFFVYAFFCSLEGITSDNSCNLTVVLSFFLCHNLRMGNSM